MKNNINHIIRLWKDYNIFFDKDYIINEDDFKILNPIFRIGNDYSFMIDISTTKIIKLSEHFFDIHHTKEKPLHN